jgi:hypothetical protein
VDDITNKLPEELRTNYKTHRRSSPVIEDLKATAALKLWGDRGYRDIKFEVPLNYGGKTVSVKVLAQDANSVVGVECASDVRLERLRRRVAQLHACLPADSYLVIVFPSSAGKRVDSAVELADEVWVTGINNAVEQIMFISGFQRV